MTTLYVVLHVYRETSEDNDQRKMIGVYSSEARAKHAIERLRDRPGFSDFPERWVIEPLVLDADNAWTDGFATIYRGDDYASEGR